MLACVASVPIRKKGFSTHHPALRIFCSRTDFRAKKKARISSLAGAFATRAGKLSKTLVNIDAENTQKPAQVAKEVLKEHMKAIEKKK